MKFTENNVLLFFVCFSEVFNEESKSGSVNLMLVRPRRGNSAPPSLLSYEPRRAPALERIDSVQHRTFEDLDFQNLDIQFRDFQGNLGLLDKENRLAASHEDLPYRDRSPVSPRRNDILTERKSRGRPPKPSLKKQKRMYNESINAVEFTRSRSSEAKQPEEKRSRSKEVTVRRVDSGQDVVCLAKVSYFQSSLSSSGLIPLERVEYNGPPM